MTLALALSIVAVGDAIVAAFDLGNWRYVIITGLTLLFATALDLTVYNVWPDAPSLMGAGLIIFAGLVLAWREGRRIATD